MRFRTELFALVTATAAACQSPDRPPVAPTSAPTPIAAKFEPMPLQIVGTKVTPVTTLFVAQEPKPVEHDLAAPFSLTASDGSGLLLTKVDAKAVVEGPLAFTELHLYFHNPESRTREGTFAITLPQGAAVSRFAMETDGKLLEAEVVEKQLARRAYDDFLHRKQDPALLEKGEGNQFTAKIFPITANSDKHVVISFSQEVTPGHYTLPLRGLSKSDAVDVRVQVRAHDGNILEQTFAQRNWVADRDLVVNAESLVAPAAIVAGELAAARVTISTQNASEVPTALTVLVDTSASRALGFDAYTRRIESLVADIARTYGAMPIQVVAFDQVTTSIYEGSAGQAANGTISQALAKRGALGASDISQALAWLGQHAPKSRVVIVGDGVVTAGATADKLAAAAKALAAQGVERVDVALAGGIRDEHVAEALARAGLPHPGAVLDLDKDTSDAARRIGLAVKTDLPVVVENAQWVFPRAIAAAQPGDEFTIYVRRDQQARNLAITIGGSTSTFAPIAVTPTLVSRAIASNEIAEMDVKLRSLSGDEAKKLKAEIIAKSLANRVVSSQTSMLVLESDGDYARFGIDRTALADILTIGAQGVELSHRAQQVAQIAQPIVTAKPTTQRDNDKQKLATESKSTGDVEKADKLQIAGKVDEKEALDELSKDQPAMKAGESVEDDLKVAGSSGMAGQGQGNAPGAPPPPPMMDPRAAGSSAGAPSPDMAPPRIERDARRFEPVTGSSAGNNDSDDGVQDSVAALRGPLAEIEGLIKSRRIDAALTKAQAWHAKQPGDVLALIGLGDAMEANKDLETAGRVYGSIIDLFPNRADFRRFAGERLERVGNEQRKLVIDTYRRAVEDRPDHLTGHRLLAYALVRDGQYADAFAAILAGIDHRYPDNRFAGGERVLHEDAGMIAASVIAHDKTAKDTVMAELGKRGLKLATRASTRFIMYWETDANDVDFHIRDAQGGHAWYSNLALPSGGELYADITTGYGPECFAINGKPAAGPYRLSINYYSQGPMGYGMGLLQIQKFDGAGGITFEDRPYVIMNDHAFVDLGTYRP